ncbi:hypothetical protein [Streptomyces sp. MAR4 CNX-425]|uniref:TPR repeat region-containing protein n=1 Tax=Streptomyces sp. MAR4 CNX-425 TaxID=3406343 RepID=UPI003B50E3E2
MVAYRQFTWQDVEAKGKQPWTMQQKFSAEVDTEAMAESAAAYARASGEAKTVDDLAEKATRISQDAGNLNGAPLVKNGRFQETHEALRRGGDEIDRVVTYIMRGMNRAIDAEKECHTHVGRINRMLDIHQRRGVNEWNAAAKAFNEAARNHNGAGEPSVAWGGKNYSAPQVLADEIRNKHLTNAHRDAGHASDKIWEEINAYRGKMTDLAAELAKLGYELANGPFKAFATPEMARYTAWKLQQAMRNKKRNAEEIERYTAGLRSIAERIYGDPFLPREKNSPRLTAEELAYLKQFFHGLDAGTLSTLGNWHDASNSGIWARTNVANGIMMMMNDEIGGIHQAGGQPLNRNEIPASVRNFVYDYENNLVDAKNREELGKWLSDFNGFGNLMEGATVRSDTHFSKDLAHAALDVETKIQGRFPEPGPDGEPVINSGSSGLLTAASLNTTAAADLLNDKAFRQGLLSSAWQDSSGAGALVASGTEVPPGVDPNSDTGRKYWQAAHGVLAYVGDNPAGPLPILGRVHDPSDLQEEIGNLAIRNMSEIARDSGKGLGVAFWDTDGLPNTPQIVGLRISDDQRQGLFSYMNDSDATVRRSFFQDVATWQYRSALGSFEGNGIPRPDAFHRIGLIQGTVADTQDRNDDYATIAGSVNAIGTFVSASPEPVSSGVGAASAALGAGAAMYFGNKEDLSDERLEAKVAIANAAIDAGVNNAAAYADSSLRRPEVRGPDGHMRMNDDYDPVRLQRLVLEGMDLESFNDGFNKGSGS